MPPPLKVIPFYMFIYGRLSDIGAELKKTMEDDLRQYRVMELRNLSKRKV